MKIVTFTIKKKEKYNKTNKNEVNVSHSENNIDIPNLKNRGKIFNEKKKKLMKIWGKMEFYFPLEGKRE